MLKEVLDLMVVQVSFLKEQLLTTVIFRNSRLSRKSQAFCPLMLGKVTRDILRLGKSCHTP